MPDNPRAFAVHVGGVPLADALRELGSIVARRRPLAETLALVCRRVADAFGAEVATVYLRERDPFLGDDELVMRGNVGFPEEAIGTVRLRVGEGLAGLAAKCLRPVSLAAAPGDPQYLHVPGLGEERYPAFLAVPLVVGDRATGVLVIQRRAPRFSSADVAIGLALAGTIAAVVARGADPAMPSPGGRLVGRTVSPGWAVAPATAAPPLDVAAGVEDAPRALAEAFLAVARELDDARRRLRVGLDGGALRGVVELMVLVEDRRLRELATRLCVRHDVPTAIRRLERAYWADLPSSELVAAPGLLQRSAELRDLGYLVALRAARVPFPPAGAVLLVERLSTTLVLAAAARAVAGIAVSEVVEPAGLAAVTARAARIPVIAEVVGLPALVGGAVALDADAATIAPDDGR